jgi:hypothetical protein
MDAGPTPDYRIHCCTFTAKDEGKHMIFIITGPVRWHRVPVHRRIVATACRLTRQVRLAVRKCRLTRSRCDSRAELTAHQWGRTPFEAVSAGRLRANRAPFSFRSRSGHARIANIVIEAEKSVGVWRQCDDEWLARSSRKRTLAFYHHRPNESDPLTVPASSSKNAKADRGRSPAVGTAL